MAALITIVAERNAESVTLAERHIPEDTQDL